MTVGSTDAMTYVPKDDEAARLTELVGHLSSDDRGTRAALVDADGVRIELPDAVFDVLVTVVRAMAEGEGISVVPRSKLLTTQESADLLGMSRPTLIRLLESGAIPFTKHGRHRRVRLQDLLDYQERARKGRSDALDRLARLDMADGAYDATLGLSPRNR